MRRTRQLRVRTVAPDARVRAATAFPDLGFDAAPPAPHAPNLDVAAPTRALIGRRAERQWLVDRLADAQQERAHVVLLRGEAGVGKSRLARELVEDARPWITTSIGRFREQTGCRTTPSPATDDGSRRSLDTLEGDDVTPGDPTGGCVTRSIID